jgi:hypothetical protein
VACIMYVDCLRRYRFVFKHFISGTLRKQRRSVKKKRDVDHFFKADIRQLIYYKSMEQNPS